MERSPSVRRCATYTRKSSEEGLTRDFNSLHAQREAFIKSQQSEGWRLLKIAYDDGGFSGATTERPALQRLLADIREGHIDVVVTYNVDRLTPCVPKALSGGDEQTRVVQERNGRIPDSPDTDLGCPVQVAGAT